MSARDAILSALSDRPKVPPDQIVAEAQALLAGIELPATPGNDIAAGFLAKLSLPSIAATHDAVPDWAAVPGVLAAHLTAQGERLALYLPPDPSVRALDWSGWQVFGSIPVDDAAALAVAVAGVAETGSLVFDTGANSPMLPNFLALHHLVIVERGVLVRHLDDIPPPAAQPRTRYWVTGVSGTTDIEGQYVRGAHGPRFLHVVLVG